MSFTSIKSNWPRRHPGHRGRVLPDARGPRARSTTSACRNTSTALRHTGHDAWQDERMSDDRLTSPDLDDRSLL